MVQMNKTITDRMNKDSVIKNSGCIINTCGIVDDEGIKLHIEEIKALHINVVICIGSDIGLSKITSALVSEGAKVTSPSLQTQQQLYSQSQSSSLSQSQIQLPVKKINWNIHVVSCPLSQGIQVRTSEQRKELREQRFLHYFEGPQRNLDIHLITHKHLDKAQFFQIRSTRDAQNLNSSALPLTQEKIERISSDELRKIDSPKDFFDIYPNRIVAVLNEISPNEKGSVPHSIFGLVRVESIDPAKNEYTLWQPAPGDLPMYPNNRFVIGEIDWNYKLESKK
ncbi:MAG: hypothetical protein EZS28_019804 [Streblomastix strix]|uniref:Uncharacterized protein n=1 Tax=Streblomastix strix TaxID=222440 RepID=A0A5J4VQP6_9EUKA|nr:MAG: hypothetical protein EZS28_019804 [Streblomastix strix]